MSTTTPETELTPNIDKALVNLRVAMRLVYEYQQHVLRIAEFIRKQTDFPDFAGEMWYDDDTFTKGDRYRDQNRRYLDLDPNMWPWKFLPGYSFEYHLGAKQVEVASTGKKMMAEMSLLQISDDGSYFADFDKREHARDICSDSPQPVSFDRPEKSNSWLAFYVDIYSDDDQPNLWFKESADQTGVDATWAFFDGLFIKAHDQDEAVMKWGDLQQGEVTVFQKFKLQHFVTHTSTLETIAKFRKTVLDQTGVDLLFK